MRSIFGRARVTQRVGATCGCVGAAFGAPLLEAAVERNARRGHARATLPPRPALTSWPCTQ